MLRSSLHFSTDDCCQVAHRQRRGSERPHDLQAARLAEYPLELCQAFDSCGSVQTFLGTCHPLRIVEFFHIHASLSPDTSLRADAIARDVPDFSRRTCQEKPFRLQYGRDHAPAPRLAKGLAEKWGPGAVELSESPRIS